MSETPSQPAPAAPTPYRSGQVAHLVLSKAAEAAAADLKDNLAGKKVLVTADTHLVQTFVVARQVEDAIALQLQRATEVLGLAVARPESSPGTEQRLIGVGGLETAGTVLEIAKGIWDEAVTTLTRTTTSLAKESVAADFETIVAVSAALAKEPLTLILDEARVPASDAAPLAAVAALRQKLAELEGKREQSMTAAEAARLEAMIEETSAFLKALLTPGTDGSIPPLVVAASRLNVDADMILVVRPASIDIHQTTITQVASAPQYIVEAFARIPYLLVDAKESTTVSAGLGTGTLRHRATFGRNDTIARWEQIDDIQRSAPLPRAVAVLQATAATIAAFILVAGFTLPFAFTVKTVLGTNDDAVTLTAERLAPESWWQMLLLIAPVIVSLLVLAFRQSQLGVVVATIGVVLLAVVAALQWAEFDDSHLLVIGLGTVLPVVLLSAALALQLRACRSGAARAPSAATAVATTPTPDSRPATKPKSDV